MKVGSDFKRISKNRGFTEGTYSKFEENLVDMNVVSYIQLLNRFDIMSVEFLFFQNNYQCNQNEKLMRDLFLLPNNQIESLKELQVDAKMSLQTQYAENIYDIQLICEALISLYERSDIIAAQKIVEPIWERLSRHEQLYLSDIRLINTILFLFPIDTAIEFTNNILRRLKEYNGFQDSDKLNLSFRINLSLLLIKNKDYTKALNLIQETIENYKQSMSYQSFAIYLSREAICRNKLRSGSSEEYLHKAQQLLSIYEDNEFEKRILEEYRYYCNL